MLDIYERHYEAIYQYILFLTTNPAIVDDFVQETFIRFYHTKQIQNEKVLLIRIARNLVYDHFRRKRLLKWLPLAKIDYKDEAPLPEELLLRSQEVQELYKALAKIKMNYREVIVLRSIEELSVKEVAHYLELSEVQVKNYTAQGLKVLRNIIGREADV
ncbi:sigma-70 family RNA polymerase sigma factor [Metasolibacillus meyeri]|uniref:Sigma-70 family RNA polymerase sigma factor n=1 Tax=Metasolibacillus meyeri TaxID=1071052 RepID=A0AAW9NVP0_9BACL|nr:sigma-70 family RNA polymerase sigma factor [Metasolibacillus meyeri]MEC1180651.1 sigma-70 family RNA polymerase sigma factor [Metasolibacillus meyeri]